MPYFVFLYLIPGVVTTILLDQFVDYQGGESFLQSLLESYTDEYRNYLLAAVSFCPFINIITTILLLIWYVFESSDEDSCGD